MVRTATWLPVFSLLSANAIAYKDWTPAAPGDSRSPCPLLNSLANHNFLPHSGKDISVQNLLDALDEALNIDDTARAFFQIQGNKALTISTTGNNATFNLFDLRAHNVIEHDGSLSRVDIGTGNGDNWSFDQPTFDETKGYWTEETITIDIGARALFKRQITAKKNNPNYTLPQEQLINAVGQTAMYLGAIGDYATGNVTKEWVVSFFENERLPYELGWSRKPDDNPITQAGIVGLITKVAASFQQIANATKS